MENKESLRVAKFRAELAGRIPRFPNNKESMSELMGCSLASLLLYYMSWAVRFVTPQQRRSVILPEVTNDYRWPRLRAEIESLLRKSEGGEPLHSHLSEKVMTRGFAGRTAGQSPSQSQWEDKDQILTIMGFHHFHLSSRLRGNGTTERTKELLFAEVGNETFTAIAIVDHSFFDGKVKETGRLAQERERLWNASMRRKSEGLPPGTGFFPYLISSSGHNSIIAMSAMVFARIIRDLDPKLDDTDFIAQLYSQAGKPAPARPNLKWSMNHIDIGVVDAENLFFTLAYGKS